MFDKIVNPSTNKKIKINSIAGKKILKNYIDLLNTKSNRKNLKGGAHKLFPDDKLDVEEDPDWAPPIPKHYPIHGFSHPYIKKHIHIIGAGPVGLYTAYKILNKHYNIALVEGRKVGIQGPHPNYVSPRISIWEKRESEQAALTRENVMFLMPTNPALSDITLKDAFIKNGMCQVAAQPWIVQGAVCSSPQLYVQPPSTGGYTMPINKIQKALFELLKFPAWKSNIEFIYGHSLIKENVGQNNIIIDSSGGRSQLVSLGEEAVLGTKWGKNDYCVRNFMTEKPDAYGMTINIPCSAIAPIPRRGLYKQEVAVFRQNTFRMLPSYTVYGDTASCDKFSYYIGFNLTEEEYKTIPSNRSKNYNMSNLSINLYRKIIATLDTNGFDTRNMKGYEFDPNFRKTLENVPVAAFPITVGYKNDVYYKDVQNNTTYFIVGDSVLNVHFFAGTGINAGMRMASVLVDNLVVDQNISNEVEDQHNQLYQNNIHTISKAAVFNSCGVLDWEKVPDASVCKRQTQRNQYCSVENAY